MKNQILLFSMLAMFQAGFSQSIDFPIDAESGEIVYSNVIEVSNSKKDDLYIKANEWVVSYFKSAKDAIQYSDMNSGKIIAKGNFDVFFTALGITKNMGYVSFTIELAFKDGKYRYVIKDIWHHDATVSDVRAKKPEGGLTNKAWASVKEQTKMNITSLVADVQKAMIAVGDNDNW